MRCSMHNRLARRRVYILLKTTPCSMGRDFPKKAEKNGKEKITAKNSGAIPKSATVVLELPRSRGTLCPHPPLPAILATQLVHSGKPANSNRSDSKIISSLCAKTGREIAAVTRYQLAAAFSGDAAQGDIRYTRITVVTLHCALLGFEVMLKYMCELPEEVGLTAIGPGWLWRILFEENVR